jgi:hypothetical protein
MRGCLMAIVVEADGASLSVAGFSVASAFFPGVDCICPGFTLVRTVLPAWSMS